MDSTASLLEFVACHVVLCLKLQWSGILQCAADKCHGHALPADHILLLCRFPGLEKVHHRVTLALLVLMTQRQGC